MECVNYNVIAMLKPKIFVSAFSCMPHLGSEPGVGWHWIMEMSKYFELWVLVHKEPADDIEEYVSKTGIDQKIHFIYYDIPFNWLFFSNNRFRWVRIYYLLWVRLSNRIVKKTMRENNITIFHNLTFGNSIWPVSRYGQKQFFVWGPIGGVETVPAEFTCHYGLKSRIIEWLRRVMVKMIHWNPGFNNRCKNADLIFCKTEAMRMAISKKYRHKAILFTDVAIESAKKNQTFSDTNHTELQYITVGRLDAWRGFDILIEAFSAALAEYPNMKLTIIGDGSDRNRLESLIHNKNVGKYIIMAGNISTEQYNKMISTCDVVLNGCLKEGAVTVSFDSVCYRKPLICVDSGGFTRYFSDCAIVLPRQNRDDLIQSMKQAILDMTNKNRRVLLGELTQKSMENFSWEYKGQQIFKIINYYF